MGTVKPIPQGDSRDFSLIEFNTPQGAVNYRTVNKYQFLNDAYMGAGGFFGLTDGVNDYSYIVHSRSETPKKYIERVNRSYYYNMFEPFITAQYRPVSSEQPPTTAVLDSNGNAFEVDTPYQEWLKDVTGNGISKDKFYQNMARASYTDAVAYAIMDKMDGDLEPYVYYQCAGSVCEDLIRVDRKGNLTQIAFLVVDGVNKKGDTVYRRTTWTNEDVTEETSTDKEKWKVESRKPLQVDSMPVYPMFSGQRVDMSDYLPTPKESYKVAAVLVSLYNAMAEYGWHITQQALARMVTDADIESVGDGYSVVVKLDSVSGAGTPSLSYVNADTGIAPNHKEHIEKITNDLINIMAEAGVVVSRMETSQAESGRAKSFTYRGQNTKLNNTVGMYRDMDEWLQKFYKQYNDPNGQWTAVTTYKTDYSIQDPVTIADLSTVVDIVKENGLLDSFKATIKNVMRSIVGSDSEYKLVEAEIDELVSFDGVISEE